MELKERLVKLSEYAKKAKSDPNILDHKYYTILPLINALGYDVFDADEVIASYAEDADNPENAIDFVVMKDFEPIMLFHVATDDEAADKQKMEKAFSSSSAKFIADSNKNTISFYTDLDADGEMDKVPFFTYDYASPDEEQMTKIELFAKEAFDNDKIRHNATNLKFYDAFRSTIVTEFENPSDDFVDFFAKKSLKISSLENTDAENMKDILKKSLNLEIENIVEARILERLQNAAVSDYEDEVVAFEKIKSFLSQYTESPDDVTAKKYRQLPRYLLPRQQS